MAYDLTQEIEAAALASPVVRDLPEPVAGRVLHIDGDYLAYYCSGKDETLSGQARRNLLDRIETTRVMAGCDSVVVHLSSPGCTKAHRFIIATVKPYQGQRTGTRPKNWQYLREFMTHYEGHAFKTKTWATREADDGMAFNAYKNPIVISTRDKDMRMLPGKHVSWESYALIDVPIGCFSVVGCDGLQYGHKWFWLQMLQGDTADNIPGLERFVQNGKEIKIGDATAAKFLATSTDNLSAYLTVKALYRSYYSDWADRIAEQAGLLWLRTDAAASIGNVLSILPADPEIIEAVRRLELRVTEGINALSRINGQSQA